MKIWIRNHRTGFVFSCIALALVILTTIVGFVVYPYNLKNDSSIQKQDHNSEYVCMDPALAAKNVGLDTKSLFRSYSSLTTTYYVNPPHVWSEDKVCSYEGESIPSIPTIQVAHTTSTDVISVTYEVDKDGKELYQIQHFFFQGVEPYPVYMVSYIDRVNGIEIYPIAVDIYSMKVSPPCSAISHPEGLFAGFYADDTNPEKVSQYYMVTGPYVQTCHPQKTYQERSVSEKATLKDLESFMPINVKR